MNYLFVGCREACALPGRACTACGGCFDAVEAQCGSCCEELGASWNYVINAPLGLYAVLAVVLSALEIGCCMYALSYSESFGLCVITDGMGSSVGAQRWLYGQLGAAWLNLVFAPYIRYRMWENLQEASTEVSMAHGVGRGACQLPKSLVKQAFSDVFWHDIGVCLYVFASITSCVWSYFGFTWVSGVANCDPDGWSTAAALLGAAFFFFLIVYFLGFSMYLECMSTLEVAPPARAKPAAAAEAAGFLAPAPSAPPMPTASPPRRTCLQRACHPLQLIKLVACIGLDVFGDATYLLPGLGEGVDIVFAPVLAVALKMLFRRNSVAIFGLVEELLPFTDFIPTATIAWFLEVCGAFGDPDDHPVPGQPVR